MDQDDLYSRFVSGIKFVLPLLALVLLSTLFLFSGKVDVTKSLVYAELNVDEIIREQRISQPYYTGQTEDGLMVSFSAAYATPLPDDQNSIDGHQVSGFFEAPDGTQISVSAPRAEIQGAQNSASLYDGVVIATSDYIVVQTDRLNANFAGGILESAGAVTGESPLGDLDAGKMRLQSTADTQTLVFTNGIKLVYQRKE